MNECDVVIGIVARDGNVLICRRRPEDPFGEFWEFPGGKREGEETIAGCLHRELLEELGIKIRVLSPLEMIEHTYPNVRVRLHPFLCAVDAGEPQPLAAEQVRWVRPRELRAYCFPPANDTLIEAIIRASGSG